MLLARLFARRDSRSPSRSLGPMKRPAASRRRTQRSPHVELLEDRMLLSGWVVDAVGTIDDPNASGVATDFAGNVYVTGVFNGTVSFGAAGSLTSAGGDDIFVAKYTPAGVPVWARRAGGPLVDCCGNSTWDGGDGIAVDPNGNVYVTGKFGGTADFGASNLVSAGGRDIFVTKLDSAGNFLWSRGVGSTGEFEDGQSIAVDAVGGVYVTGRFAGVVDFDPAPSALNLTSAGDLDIFVWKLDTEGNAAWAVRAGSPGEDIGLGIAVDSSGNAATTGMFEMTVDFGATILTSTGAKDAYVWKLDSAGNSVWAGSMGSPEEDDLGKVVAIDAGGNIYTSGAFFGITDRDPGPGTAVVSGYDCTRRNSRHLFVSKLDASGNLVWARTWNDIGPGGTGGLTGIPITLDSSGNVYVGSSSGYKVDFDPGPGVAPLTGASLGFPGVGAFVLKLDSEGNYIWARQSNGPTSTNAGVNGLKADSSGNVYAVGGFSSAATSQPVTFDVGDADIPLTPSAPSAFNLFVLRMEQAGTTSASIQGRVFNDSNNNGADDSTEARLQGWTIYLDTNNNGQLNDGEPSTTSGRFGEYQFKHLAAGTYVVREIVQAGWTQTTPSGGSFTVTLADGQFAVQSIGNFNPSQSPAGWLPVAEGCKDLQTGLIWATEGGGGVWNMWPAQDGALNNNQHGFSDWGLPSIAQLATADAHGLLGHTNYSSHTWSTSLANTSGTLGWYYSFATGTAEQSQPNWTRSLMLVRGSGLFSDDGDAGYSDTVTGWSVVTGQGREGDYRVHAKGNGSAKATWTFTGLPAAQYKVLASWVALSNNATNAPYQLFDNATLLKTSKVNQKNPPSSKQSGSYSITIPWGDLGTVSINTGTLKVVLNNNANGNVVADMVRLVPIQATATAALVASRDRYAGIDQVLASRYSDEERHDHTTASESLRDLLAARGGVGREATGAGTSCVQ